MRMESLACRISGCRMSVLMEKSNKEKMLQMRPRPRAFNILYILLLVQHIAAWDRNTSRASGSSSNISTRLTFHTQFCVRWHLWTITIGDAPIYLVAPTPVWACDLKKACKQ